MRRYVVVPYGENGWWSVVDMLNAKCVLFPSERKYTGRKRNAQQWCDVLNDWAEQLHREADRL
jgi:hypothetical protein